jgi:multisubunit Na+/H+ antiporter MnhB subunit
VLTSTLVLVRAVLPGVGGSLGFAAFVTVAILVALNRAAAHWQPNPQSEPRTSSNLNTLARLGAAIANGGVATFVVASLLHGNAVLPDRRAEDVSDPMGGCRSNSVAEAKGLRLTFGGSTRPISSH